MEKVKNLMNQRKLKKFDLRKMGINGSVLDKVLNGRLDKNKRVDTETINKLCKLLNCQPGDIMEYVPDKSSEHPKNIKLKSTESNISNNDASSPESNSGSDTGLQHEDNKDR
jgi:DNA-binding Xre family transcriptional regulator